MEQSKLKKALIILSGIAFLGSSLLGIGELIGSSLKEPVVKENPAQSQNAQLNATEKGFLGVLKREPNNQTALRGIQEIVNIRLEQRDIPGTKAILKQLIVESSLPLKAVELDFAVDSSGFSSSRFTRWYDQKYGKLRETGNEARHQDACG